MYVVHVAKRHDPLKTRFFRREGRHCCIILLCLWPTAKGTTALLSLRYIYIYYIVYIRSTCYSIFVPLLASQPPESYLAMLLLYYKLISAPKCLGLLNEDLTYFSDVLTLLCLPAVARRGSRILLLRVFRAGARTQPVLQHARPLGDGGDVRTGGPDQLPQHCRCRVGG